MRFILGFDSTPYYSLPFGNRCRYAADTVCDKHATSNVLMTLSAPLRECYASQLPGVSWDLLRGSDSLREAGC